MRKVLLLAIIVAFAFTGIASARGPGAGNSADLDQRFDESGKFWQREKVSQELSLSEEEKENLTELYNSHREKVQGLREDLGKEMEALREIMDSTEVSSSDARKYFANAEKIRSVIQAERFELRLAQRQLLGKERFAKLRKMEKHMKQRRKREKR